MFYIKNKLKFIFLLPILFPLIANATIVVTSVKTITSPAHNLRLKDYQITWKKIPGPKDNEKIPAGIRYYGAMEEHDRTAFACDSGGAINPVNPTKCIPVNGNVDTWNDVENRWIQKYGATGPGTVGHYGETGFIGCVMFAAQYSLGDPIGQQVNNGPLTCVGAPPVTELNCFLDENPTLEFNIQAGQLISNMSIEKTINFSCSLDADVVLINPEFISYVDFGWGKVDITINNMPLPYTMNKVKNKALSIKGVLNGMAPSAGVFEKNMILVISYN